MTCEYGEANREMIKEVQKAVIDLRNHYSNRLPLWATVLITLLAATLARLL